MNNQEFDSQLKSTLEKLEVPLDKTAWAAFEQHLPPVTPAADAMEQAVRRSLEQLEAPYQPVHWDRLADQLARIEQLRRRIWGSKAAEAAIFLLLLLLANAYGFLGFEHRHTAPTPSPDPGVPMAKAGTGNSHKNRALQNGNSPENVNAFFVPLDTKQRLANQPIGADLTSEAALAANISANSAAPAGGDGQAQRSLMLPFDALSRTDFLTLPTSTLLHPWQAVLANKTPGANHFYAVTYAALEENRVHLESGRQKSTGYGGGLAVGYRPGKWGVEAGLAFSQKEYVPQKHVSIYTNDPGQGYYTTYIDQVTANVVAMPVKVTRQVVRFVRTAVHATAGLTASVAIEKSYRYREEFHAGAGPVGMPNTQPAEQNRLGKGAFEGASFKENAYVTADLGLRVEHALNKRLVAFVEPVYQWNTSRQGIGPKPARVNTVGLHAGVMASL